MQLVRVGFLGQQRGAVVVLEGQRDGLAVVLEVEHEAVVLLRVGPVQARERLHCLHAGQGLVHVHRVQQWLVVAGLKLVGANEKAIGVVLNLVGDVLAREAVERRFADLGAAELMLAREGNDGLVRAFALHQVGLHRMEILDGTLDAAGHHHGPGLPADLAGGQHLLVEVVHHDLGFQLDRVIVALYIAPQLLFGLLGVELRVVLDLLDQLVVAVDGNVVLQHVQDEALLHRLLHAVVVERLVLDLALGIGRQRLAEHLQRLVLRRRGEREVAGVREHLPRGHARFQRCVNHVLGVTLFVVPARCRVGALPQGLAHGRRGLAALS